MDNHSKFWLLFWVIIVIFILGFSMTISDYNKQFDSQQTKQFEICVKNGKDFIKGSCK